MKFITLFLLMSTLFAELPDDFKYNGKEIPDDVLRHFFSDMTFGPVDMCNELDLSECKKVEDEERISRQWRYEGMIKGKIHLVWAYYWDDFAMGKFSTLMLVKREGDKLVVTDYITGGDRHSSMVHGGSIEDGCVTYSKCVSSAELMDRAVELFPELLPKYNRSSKAGFCYGEAGFYGGMNFRAYISPEGLVEKRELISYQRPEGEPDSQHIYTKSELKELALNELIAVDAHVDPELKEDGISYSNALYLKLLEENLQSDTFKPNSVSISEYKDQKSPYYTFTFEYLFRLRDFHLVKAYLWKIGVPYKLGIYSIKKEGDQLKVLDLIAETKGSDYLLSSVNPAENNAITYWKYVTSEELSTHLNVGLPSSEGHSARALLKANISNEGKLISQSVVELSVSTSYFYKDKSDEYDYIKIEEKDLQKFCNEWNK